MQGGGGGLPVTVHRTHKTQRVRVKDLEETRLAMVSRLRLILSAIWNLFHYAGLNL